MFLSFARRFALGAAVLQGGLACSSSSSSGGLAPTPHVDAGSATLSFGQAGELTLSPLEAQTISVLLSGGDGQVTLWLSGEYADASLSDGQVTTSGGSASFTLHAPSVATTFSIFARAAGSQDARLDVAVSASGFATVVVTASYAGRRPMPSVVASVFVASKCDDLSGELADGSLGDGAPSVTGVLASPITLESVPAGSHIAVSVRVDEYAAGCVDLGALAAMATKNVPVAILDRPMALGATSLGARFGLSIDPTAQSSASAMLDGAIARAEASFVPQSQGEAAALLDAMAAAVPQGSEAQFQEARSQQGWDATADAWLEAGGPGLRALADMWLRQGATAALGDVTALLTAGQTVGYATVTLGTFATLDAASAGVTVTSPFAWTADANDVVHLAGAVHIAPTALVCASAAAPANQAVPGATDVPTALAASIDCAGLSNALVGPSGSSYPSCDVGCTATLCATALAAMWSSARGASAAAMDDVALTMTTSAQATVDQNAAPATFSGAWVGEAQSSLATFSSFSIHGDAEGQSASTPPH